MSGRPARWNAWSVAVSTCSSVGISNVLISTCMGRYVSTQNKANPLEQRSLTSHLGPTPRLGYEPQCIGIVVACESDRVREPTSWRAQSRAPRRRERQGEGHAYDHLGRLGSRVTERAAMPVREGGTASEPLHRRCAPPTRT